MRTLNATLMNSMTLAELETEIDCVTRDISQIKAQIDLAKAGQKQSGVYADAGWFARANTALRIRGREHQMLLFIAGKKRKEANVARSNAQGAEFERRFMWNAKQALPPETYQAILRMTQREFQEVAK